MATYNGEIYIEDQLNSILPQLASDDEVIVCDDGSSDDTIKKIQDMGDHRIKIILNEQKLGYIKNFEKAVSLSKGEYIFLSDQDDIWPNDRVEIMLSALTRSGKLVVVGNIECFSEDVDARYPLSMQVKNTHNRAGYKNLARIMLGGLPCYGCAMAFRREVLPYYIPFPMKDVSHDIWLALLSNFKEWFFYCEEIVVYRRVHGENLTSSSRSLYAKLVTRSRWAFLLLLLLLKRRSYED